jgi:hypothetical protein
VVGQRWEVGAEGGGGVTQKYEYAWRRARPEMDPGILYDKSHYAYVCRDAVKKLLTQMSEDGWEFCGFVPGVKHQVAEHGTPDEFMFRRPVE